MSDNNQILSNFKLVSKEAVDELSSTALVYEHIPTGARILHLKNDDDNKVFSITFRTPPTSSNGIAHILEHSVLCGSKKYPAKTPFFELSKSSLNTFLNAFTSPDKTSYPFASRNEKDFKNLLRVYLDAVLHPVLYEKPEILKQEGWRYELTPEGALTYNGVVYNEMKGVYSSPESVLFKLTLNLLYPGTTYGYDSGGNPEHIIELTQQVFTEFHRRHYHPSNSFVYLYGKVNVEEVLEIIDKEYFADFSRAETDSLVPEPPKLHTPVEHVGYYPIGRDENPEQKAYFCLAWSTASLTDPLECFGLEILKHYLMDTPAAPLKKALIKAGVAQDVYGTFYDNARKTYLSLTAKGAKVEDYDRFKNIVFDTLKEIVRKGIALRSARASFNRKVFELREADSDWMPKGLIYNFWALNSWIYDSSPLLHLQHQQVVDAARDLLDQGWLESLINEFLLDNQHRVSIKMIPKPGMAEEIAEQTASKLAQVKSSLSEDEIKQIAKDVQLLKERQQTPDSAEVLATIPILKREDLTVEAEVIPQEVSEIDGLKVLYHALPTLSILDFNVYFDSSAVPQRLIPYLSLLSSVLTNVGAGAKDYSDLADDINICTGGLDFSVETITANNNVQEFRPFLVMNSKCLAEEIPNLLRTSAEIISSSHLDDKARIKEILAESKSRLEFSIMQNGTGYAFRRATSNISQIGYYNELTKGISYYHFVRDLLKDFDNRSEEIVASLQQTAQFVFCADKALISCASDKAEWEILQSELGNFKAGLSKGGYQTHCYHFKTTKRNEGLSIPSRVQYCAQMGIYRNDNTDYKGSYLVGNKLLSVNYLLNRIRVTGGACGAFSGFSRSGFCYMGSFRDPNLRETVEVFKNASAFLRDFKVSNEELTRLIIGVIGDLDQPLTHATKCITATTHYLAGITKENLQRERNEALNCTANDICNLGDVFDIAEQSGSVVVIGNDAKIKENSELFTKVINVME